jgi:A/G-specific adenine glycosylase
MTSAGKLLRWYRQNGRDLPWRKTRDPYRILVSEIMLQQTQVDRVKTYYKEWLRKFPNFKWLAKASNSDVIHAWAGLGYNRRALALRDIAKHIKTHGTPKTEEDWQSIKGIGPYTAAALSAFAQHKRTLPIDTNIRRVLGRLLFGKPFPSLRDDFRIKAATDAFLPRRGAYYDVPQAIFDLSTSICKKEPLCKQCPLRNDCKSANAFLSGKVTPQRLTKKQNGRKHAGKRFPDRIYRGRILKLVRENESMKITKIGSQIDPTFDIIKDNEWLLAMITRLTKDGLIAKKGINITL